MINKETEFSENYLDHLRIEAAKKEAKFVDWEIVKARLDRKHGIKLTNTTKPKRATPKAQ